MALSSPHCTVTRNIELQELLVLNELEWLILLKNKLLRQFCQDAVDLEAGVVSNVNCNVLNVGAALQSQQSN